MQDETMAPPQAPAQAPSENDQAPDEPLPGGDEQPQAQAPSENGQPQSSVPPTEPDDDDDDDSDDDDDDEPSENGAAKVKKAPNGLYISTPPVLKEKIEAEAAAVGKQPRAFVRDFLAAHWGLVLTPARTRTVYESAEQKKEVLKAKRQEKNALIKRLLAEHEAAQAAAAAEAAKLSQTPPAPAPVEAPSA